MGEGDKARPPTIHASLAEKRRRPEAVLEHIGEGDDVIVGMHNSEPAMVLDAMEANADRLSGVRAHQMFACRERRYMHGVFPGLRHVSWFLSPASREAFRHGGRFPGPVRLGVVGQLLLVLFLGQPDFARGALFSEDGQSLIVLHSTTADESDSRITAQLHPGAAFTTFKNIVDRVVTEYGVAELRGSSIRERTRRLIAVAHPKFRDELEQKAREINYL